MHFGIDYGSKLAGTTVICFDEGKKLRLVQSEKNKDADAFLKKWILEKKPNQIFIDAPLSLPNAYFGKGEDFFYRHCDKEVKGMSPLFLGGLTARAMKLKSQLELPERPFFEIYPAQLLRILFPDMKFKKDAQGLSDLLAIFSKILPIPLEQLPQNRHQADAVLAWLSGWRFQKNEAILFGEKEEGLIWV